MSALMRVFLRAAILLMFTSLMGYASASSGLFNNAGSLDSATAISSTSVEIVITLDSGSTRDRIEICWRENTPFGLVCHSNSLIVSLSDMTHVSGNTYSYVIDNLDCVTTYRFKAWAGYSWILGYNFKRLSNTRYATLASCAAMMCSNPCPQGGYFDEANCQIGQPPAGTTAFIFESAYYYSPVPSAPDCPLPGSYYDGANCFVQAIPAGAHPFLYENRWYLSAACQNCSNPCPQGGGFDGANCLIGTPPAGTQTFIYANNFYYTPIISPTCPRPGSYYDEANCYVQPVPPGVTPFIYDNYWYYGRCPG